MAVSAWDKEGIVEELRKLLLVDGYSASRLADILTLKFGVRVTRNGVIGKVHRLGLKMPNSGHKRKRTKLKVERRARLQPKIISPLRRALEMAPEPMPVTEPELVIPIHERKTLLELEQYDCRWPINHVGEPDFHFCARKQVVGTPYCDFHLRRAYQPPTLRRTPSPFRPYVPASASKITEDA